MSKRYQVTKVNNVKSNLCSITCGVPQGSILGPLFFSIYINDLPDHLVKSRCNLYADDSALTVSGSSVDDVIEKLNFDFRLVNEWFKKNRLSLNAKKSKFMVFGTRSKTSQMANIQLKQWDHIIDRVTKFKYLGITLDPGLTFHDHIETIKGKTIGKVKLLSRITPYLPSKLNLELYTSLIRPHFDFGDVIFDYLSQKDSQTLQKLQNMWLKNILRVPKRSSTVEIHDAVNLELLSTRRWRHTAIEMYKVAKNMQPVTVQHMFTLNTNVHHRQTRHSQVSLFYRPRARLKLTKKSFRHRGVRVWDKVPLAIQTAPSLCNFKEYIKLVSDS